MTAGALATVEFHGATLVALQGDTPASTLVAMRPVAEGMGLAWQVQHRKLADHPVLGRSITNMVMETPAGPRPMTALPLSRLNFWLATIQPNKIRNPDTRAKVIRYQEECADVLFAHFFGKTAAGRSDRSRRVALAEAAAYAKLYGHEAAHWHLEQAGYAPPPDVVERCHAGRRTHGAAANRVRRPHATDAEATGPLVEVLRAWLAKRPGADDDASDKPLWRGTATDLLAQLNDAACAAVRRQGGWPVAANELSARLRRLMPELMAAGVLIEMVRRGHHRERVILITWRRGEARRLYDA